VSIIGDNQFAVTSTSEFTKAYISASMFQCFIIPWQNQNYQYFYNFTTG
jgi:hypothetical protein